MICRLKLSLKTDSAVVRHVLTLDANVCTDWRTSANLMADSLQMSCESLALWNICSTSDASDAVTSLPSEGIAALGFIPQREALSPSL